MMVISMFMVLLISIYWMDRHITVKPNMIDADIIMLDNTEVLQMAKHRKQQIDLILILHTMSDQKYYV